ncbi:MAG: hypothetical protein IT298_11705 [Chloroflexi bacterium]|jgi:hypothetical protein|nr:MAG: hypothetical protein UZ13_00827 [Chloroflexi bacterium OLB13]MBC6957664.1 hypothetical protein [Chloroflexota bacterium]MBV6437690.1 hypothetical protein [Anaerolineae bacterium]MDL1916053.1 hypothetical protein [Anaerolineae bacterium CFX4]OQY76899.1 MAG: hypothetical protein B6D42_16830 [Anaerolineae bacterium UTCFX5]
MNRIQLAEAMELDPAGDMFITDLELNRWGRELVFVCEYVSPSALSVPFRLRFTDCRDLRWKTYAHAAFDELPPSAELIEFAPGSGNHRRDASLLTVHFAATLSYGTLIVEFGGREIAF